MHSVPNKLKLILILSISLLFFCANCRKDPKPKEIQLQYPEDPATTTLTPRERLTGSWRVYGYQFKGHNILEKIDTVNNSLARIEDVAFYYDYSSSYKTWLFSLSSQYINFTAEESFNIDDPSYINIWGPNICCKGFLAKWFITPFQWDPGTPSTAKWLITKLFNKELNLVLETDSGDYKILLKKRL